MSTSRAGSGSRTRSLVSMITGAGAPVIATDTSLIAVRTALVWVFTYYGAGKLFGAFHGPGLHRTAVYFASTAHLRPGEFFAVLGGVVEFGGALALAFGLGSRLAGLALLGDQTMAMITVTWRNGINSLSDHPGYEFNLTLCALALVIVVWGAGRLSLDAMIDRRLGGETTPSRPPSGNEYGHAT